MVLLLGWGRAILMQFAHPLVAAGVAQHSLFVKSPALRRQRLLQTVNAMLALTFGTREEAERAAAGINAIHDRVHGRLDETTGRFASGTQYSAHDPELLRWVHATLMDSFPLTYRRLVGPLPDGEIERYYCEASGLEPLLGIPTGFVPQGTDALRDYMEGMTASGAIQVGSTARALARELLDPPLRSWPPVLWPLATVYRVALWWARLPAVGLLPGDVRAAYGFRWTRGHRLALDLLCAVSRLVVPRLPGVLRYWPAARRARRREVRGA
jgi:uncharacterized protein (DUF2236 family)